MSNVRLITPKKKVRVVPKAIAEKLIKAGWKEHSNQKFGKVKVTGVTKKDLEKDIVDLKSENEKLVTSNKELTLQLEELTSKVTLLGTTNKDLEKASISDKKEIEKLIKNLEKASK